jgi:hypothetical protein
MAKYHIAVFVNGSLRKYYTAKSVKMLVNSLKGCRSKDLESNTKLYPGQNIFRRRTKSDKPLN